MPISRFIYPIIGGLANEGVVMKDEINKISEYFKRFELPYLTKNDVSKRLIEDVLSTFLILFSSESLREASSLEIDDFPLDHLCKLEKGDSFRDSDFLLPYIFFLFKQFEILSKLKTLFPEGKSKTKAEISMILKRK